jgi:hypothetical protein
MQGGARRPHARRTACTLSARPGGANVRGRPFSAALRSPPPAPVIRRPDDDDRRHRRRGNHYRARRPVTTNGNEDASRTKSRDAHQQEQQAKYPARDDRNLTHGSYPPSPSTLQPSELFRPATRSGPLRRDRGAGFSAQGRSSRTRFPGRPQVTYVQDIPADRPIMAPASWRDTKTRRLGPSEERAEESSSLRQQAGLLDVGTLPSVVHRRVNGGCPWGA